MMIRVIMAILLLSSTSLTYPTEGYLLSGPIDVFATEGETIHLSCRSNLTTTVRWILGHPGTVNVRVIFEATSDNKGYIYTYFKERFSCVRQQDGYQNLVIRNANISDTGNYTCIDDEGFGFHPERPSYGRWGTATLIVDAYILQEKLLSPERVELSVTTGIHSNELNLYAADTSTNSHDVALVVSIDVALVVSLTAVAVLLIVIGVLILVRFLRIRQRRSEVLLETLHPGKSLMSGDHEEELDARLFLDKTKLLNVIPLNGSILGLTVLNGELFVVKDETKHVTVYNTINYTFSPRNPLTITISFALRALVGCQSNNCLYISDPIGNVVYKYNLSNNVITQWSVRGKCYGLSLTSTNNVLVTLHNTNQIKEYRPDGCLIRKIILNETANSSIDSLWRSVQLSGDRLVVSHGEFGPLHQVSVVDTSGRIMQSYGADQGSGLEQWSHPSHLTVDSYENILVADCFNDRIVLLSPSLTYLGYITVPDNELKRPWVLHLDLQNRYLYIGEMTPTGSVFVLGIGVNLFRE